MPHGIHIYETASDTDMDTMCVYPLFQHTFTHWKCVLRFCENCPYIDLSDQDSDRHNSKTSPSTRFRIYPLIENCTLYGRIPLDEDKIYCFCLQYPAIVFLAKLYTRKYLVVMETSIADFSTINVHYSNSIWDIFINNALIKTNLYLEH